MKCKDQRGAPRVGASADVSLGARRGAPVAAPGDRAAGAAGRALEQPAVRGGPRAGVRAGRPAHPRPAVGTSSVVY